MMVIELLIDEHQVYLVMVMLAFDSKSAVSHLVVLAQHWLLHHSKICQACVLPDNEAGKSAPHRELQVHSSYSSFTNDMIVKFKQ